MKIEFEIRKITILRGSGTDKIRIEIHGNTPFPELSKEWEKKIYPYFQIETRRGYAEEWLKKEGINYKFELIEMSEW